MSLATDKPNMGGYLSDPETPGKPQAFLPFLRTKRANPFGAARRKEATERNVDKSLIGLELGAPNFPKNVHCIVHSHKDNTRCTKGA